MVQSTAACTGCVPSEESWKGVSGVDSWVRNSEIGVVGRNVTQNKSKSSRTSSHTGRTSTKCVRHMYLGGLWINICIYSACYAICVYLFVRPHVFQGNILCLPKDLGLAWELIMLCMWYWADLTHCICSFMSCIKYQCNLYLKRVSNNLCLVTHAGLYSILILLDLTTAFDTVDCNNWIDSIITLD